MTSREIRRRLHTIESNVALQVGKAALRTGVDSAHAEATADLGAYVTVQLQKLAQEIEETEPCTT